METRDEELKQHREKMEQMETLLEQMHVLNRVGLGLGWESLQGIAG